MDTVATQTLLQQMADNWMLLAMFTLFLGTWVWAFLPGLRKDREDASQIPFRNETRDTATPSPDLMTEREHG